MRSDAELGQVVDLAAYREQRRARDVAGDAEQPASPPRGSYIRGRDDGRVEFRFVGEGYDSGAMAVDVLGAERIIGYFRKAVVDAKTAMLPRCERCGRKGCTVPHPGRIVEMHRDGELARAVVDGATATGWRLRWLDTGTKFYRRATWGWDYVGWDPEYGPGSRG